MKGGDAMDGQMLTPVQVSVRIGVTPATVYNWIRDGRLRAVRFGPRVLRIPEGELLKFAQAEN
jgi:excisionase family DNA binding protein